MIAFGLSAVMIVAAVVYAYLSDSMPERCLTETDKMFIADFQNAMKRVEKSHLLDRGLVR